MSKNIKNLNKTGNHFEPFINTMWYSCSYQQSESWSMINEDIKWSHDIFMALISTWKITIMCIVLITIMHRIAWKLSWKSIVKTIWTWLRKRTITIIWISIRMINTVIAIIFSKIRFLSAYMGLVQIVALKRLSEQIHKGWYFHI